MQQHGSSVALSWGEDDGIWECSWITSGVRFRGLSSDATDALDHAHQQAAERFGEPAA